MPGSGKIVYHLTCFADLVDVIVLSGLQPKTHSGIFTQGVVGYGLTSGLGGRAGPGSRATAIAAASLAALRRPRFYELLHNAQAIQPPLCRRRAGLFRKERALIAPATGEPWTINHDSSWQKAIRS